jgi:hypothetical protein
MTDYRVAVPVEADTAADAAWIVVTALGFDMNSINEIGGVQVEAVPDEKQYLVCINCGEAFDSITAAHEHGVYIPGPDPSWCGEEGFNIMPESEAL